MLSNDVFGAIPKSKCTPIISVENPLYNAVEFHVQSLFPTTLNSVNADPQICFDRIVEEEGTGIVQDSVNKNKNEVRLVDKELRTRVLIQ